MAMRRAISLLYREGYIQNEMFQALTAETVALLISTLIVIGVILIKKIFVEHEKNIEEIMTYFKPDVVIEETSERHLFDFMLERE